MRVTGIQRQVGAHFGTALPRSAACAALLLVLGAAQACASAGEAPAPGRSPCQLRAFVSETDPAGLNVRDEPSLAGRVLGRLPPVLHNPELNYAAKVEVHVLASQRGWLLIDQARDNSELTGRPSRPMYSGRGWVSGSRITMKSQASQAHAGPGRDTAVVLRDADAAAFDSDAMVGASRVLGCQGTWAHLEVDLNRLPADNRPRLEVSPAATQGLPQGRLRAWFDQICGNQETSCDGLSPGAEPAPQTPQR